MKYYFIHNPSLLWSICIFKNPQYILPIISIKNQTQVVRANKFIHIKLSSLKSFPSVWLFPPTGIFFCFLSLLWFSDKIHEYETVSTWYSAFFQMFGLKNPGRPLQMYPEEFMNLSQSYFELAEDTNIENLFLLSWQEKKKGLILGCCDRYLTPYMFLVPLT